MRVAISEGCGCFPSGRHYPGIAHLLRSFVRGLAAGFTADAAWHDLPIALVDVETTGRDASIDRVVEVGIAVGRHGEVIARYNWLIHPGVSIPEEARAVHGISDDDVKDAPRFEAVAHEIAAALSGCIPAAYNAAFDRAFLHSEFGRANVSRSDAHGLSRDVDWLDPLVWARELQREEKSKALVDVAKRLGVAHEKAHRASDDAEAALRVFYRLAEDARLPRAYGALLQEQRRFALLHADERRFWKN